MRNRHYSASGMGSQNFNHLEDDSTLDISGMGSVSISGSIGANVRINKSGMGSLNISGSVHPTAKFIISGMGSVNFSSRPPQAVLDNLEMSGMGSINVPGGYQSKSPSYSSSDVIINGGVVSSGGTMMRNMVIDGSGIRYTDANGKNVYIPSNSGGNTVFSSGTVYNTPGVTSFSNNGSKFVDIGNKSQPFYTAVRTQTPAVKQDSLSDATQSYLDKIRKQTKFSEQIETLKSRHEAKAEFISGQIEKFLDPITFNIMDEPVVLNGHTYDLSTLTKLPVDAEGYRKDPLLTFKFNLQNLQPALDLVNEFQEKITKIKSQLAATTNDASANALLGLSNATQAYVNSFKDKPKFSDTYIEILMNKTDNRSLDQFQEFFDPATLELMNIPVSVNGNVYDLDTLLKQPAKADGQREEPSTGDTYFYRDIQPARHIANGIQRELDKLRTPANNSSKQPTPAKPALAKPEVDELRLSAIAATTKAEQQAAALQAMLQGISQDDSTGISAAPHAVLFPPASPNVDQTPANVNKSEKRM